MDKFTPCGKLLRENRLRTKRVLKGAEVPKHEGVYRDNAGRWYFKANAGRDPLTGKQVQVTRRGFESAEQAAQARSSFLNSSQPDTPRTPTAMTVNDLLDVYLDSIDADARLAPKTRFDYRNYEDSYVRPWLGELRLRDVTPETVAAWQRQLSQNGGSRDGKPLSPNTIRLARAPLAGAFRHAAESGIVKTDSVKSVRRPTPKRSVPSHWSPEQAREFLALLDGDRFYTVYAFLLGSGLRIGELVWLRWANVDLERRVVRIVEFASTLGYELVASAGKSRDAVRSIEIDDGLVDALRLQRKLQLEEQLAAKSYEDTDYVFTKRGGGNYHPQSISRRLSKLSDELGLPRLTAHGLRHTSATLMLASGVPPKVAAERLGHADATLFTNLYRHVTPTMQREAADRIGQLLFRD